MKTSSVGPLRTGCDLVLGCALVLKAARFCAVIALAGLASAVLGVGGAAGIGGQAQAQQAPMPERSNQATKAPVAAQPKPSADELERWRQTIVHTKRPKKACFTAEYPAMAWTEVPCTKPPKTPFVRAKGRRPLTVGNGTEFSAQAASGYVSQAEGSFDSVTGVTSETMVLNGKESPNVFSLQLNTELVSTSACNGVSGCQGWQQFMFSNGGCGNPAACVYIQNWLFGLGSACPTKQWSFTDDGCLINSTMAARLPPIPLNALATVKLRGEVAGVDGPDDLVILTVGTTMYSAPGDNRLPDLGQNWQIAEFNIFGNGDGSEADFNIGSTLVVRAAVNSATISAPSCDANGFTGETNNLTLTATASAPPTHAPLRSDLVLGKQPPVENTAPSGWPSLVLTESNVPGVIPASCAGAATVGGAEPVLTVQCGPFTPPYPGAAIAVDFRGAPIACNSTLTLEPGTYTVQATPAGTGDVPYKVLFGDACNSAGEVTLSVAEVATCAVQAEGLGLVGTGGCKLGQRCCSPGRNGCQKCIPSNLSCP
jgi:hypothetical protein